MSRSADQKVREDLITGDINGKLVDQQKRIIDLKDLTIRDSQSQTDLWKGEALRERQYADEEKAKSQRNLWLGIGAGIALTVLSAWAVGQAAGK